ncbi:endonuclease domain of the non-LTR retrotransposon LINE-1, partial [Elysia marginata]
MNRPSVNVNKNNKDPSTLPGLKAQKRGRKGGVREQLKRRRSRSFLPELIIGNARSRNNKIEELRAYTKYLNEYRCASLLCFSETWFAESASDSSFDIDNFCQKRSDRTKASYKSRGGGTCLYVNEKWCHPNNVHVKQQLCTPDLEMLNVALRPFYPPREFTKVTVNVVYVHPKANTIAAMSTVTNNVHEQQNQSPDG